MFIASDLLARMHAWLHDLFGYIYIQLLRGFYFKFKCFKTLFKYYLTYRNRIIETALVGIKLYAVF